MPKFSQESFTKLSTCHIDLQVIFFEVIKNFDCTVLQGYRDEIDQHRAFLSGNSQLDWPNGKHNTQPSNAVDVASYPIPNWSNTGDFIFFGGYVMGIAEMLFTQGKITHKIRYGGDWSRNNKVTDESFKDYLHFEIIV